MRRHPVEGRTAWRWPVAATASAAVIVLVVAAVASGHLISVAPGKHPGDVNPHELPLRSGDPMPDRLGGDHTASADVAGGNCYNAGPVDGQYRGTLALRRYIDHWFRGVSAGIYNCRYIAGTTTPSIHAEGRALDWRLYSDVRKERRAAKRIRQFFLRRDTEGRRFAGARRWGIQQIIYNGHHWSETHPRSGWHLCEWDCGHDDHMHIEQNWRGAKRRTTAYDGYQMTHEGPHPCRVAGRARFIPC